MGGQGCQFQFRSVPRRRHRAFVRQIIFARNMPPVATLGLPLPLPLPLPLSLSLPLAAPAG